MKLCNRQLALFTTITTCTAMNKSLQGSRDLTSHLNGNTGVSITAPQVMDGSNLNAGSSPVQKSQFGHMTNASPSLPSRASRGSNLQTYSSGEVHHRPNLVPLETHIQTPSNKRNREDELFNNHPESRKPPETLDLLRDFGKNSAAGSPANAFETPRKAILSHRTMQTDGIQPPIQKEREGRFLSIDPTHTPHSYLKNLEDQLRSSVIKPMQMTPEASFRLDEILRQTSYSDGKKQSDRTLVQIENVMEPKDTATEIGTMSPSVNVIESQTSTGDRLLRLEFTHEILRTHDPLLEDERIIEEIKKLNENSKIMIVESNFKNAVDIIRNCNLMMKRDGPIELSY
ncbi:hypothetical protein PGT21_003536 [Puccinia graminis f. sp. tritici]|uniref:Uncharacterized protein n=1 Tax=Puccinia graminis f. sp. tritici TaxID=56615 RepID=A0A5B0S694_PUCGR|nr:hypothetical protein PGT21_003536 [Puccinia graminis f. sp. tritici]KAA1133661.1 hypothetical protein PGTUg99_030260 [Puccinia graminis f. sp. tritici]